MDKLKFGKLYYYCSLGLSCLVMLLAIFLLRSDGSEQSNIDMSIYRYMVAFYTFLVILSPGVLVFEYTKGNYIKEKFKLKIIILGLSLIVGTLLFLLVWNAAVANMVFLASLVVLVYVLAPTNKNQK